VSILILFAHSALQKSRVNRRLIAAASESTAALHAVIRTELDGGIGETDDAAWDTRSLRAERAAE